MDSFPEGSYTPSVCNLALFNLFISSVFNVINTDDIIQEIFSNMEDIEKCVSITSPAFWIEHM